MDYAKVLESLAGQVPNLVVFLFLVFIFLRGQTKAADRFDLYMRSRDENYDTVVNKNTEVIMDNSKALGAVTLVLEQHAKS